MTPEQLDEIEARLHYLSPAPWEHVHVFDGEEVIRVISPDGRGDRIVAYAQYEVEGRFIAAARTDVPALIAEVRRLRRALDYIGTLMEGGPAARRARSALGD